MEQPMNIRKRNFPYPIKLTELQPGDILLFRPNREFYLFQSLIMSMQALFMSHDHGHYDTTHAAICVGQSKNGPIIAHATEKEQHMGYVKEFLLDMIKRDQDDRPFIIFRHKSREAGQLIAAIANDHQAHKDIKWSISTAASALIGNTKSNQLQNKLDESALSTSTVCSKFVIECIECAAKNSRHLPYPVEELPIHSTSAPKMLESCLYKHNQYQMLCYLGKNPLETLSKETELHIIRISKRRDSISQAKYLLAYSQYKKAMQIIRKYSYLNDMQKSLILLKAILPVFKENTGLGLFETTSYKAITGLARRIGIFERDINCFSLEKYVKQAQTKTSKVIVRTAYKM